MGIAISGCEDPYEPISIMECILIRVSTVAHVVSFIQLKPWLLVSEGNVDGVCLPGRCFWRF